MMIMILPLTGLRVIASVRTLPNDMRPTGSTSSMSNAKLAVQFERQMRGESPEGWKDCLPKYSPGTRYKAAATRVRG